MYWASMWPQLSTHREDRIVYQYFKTDIKETLHPQTNIWKDSTATKPILIVVLTAAWILLLVLRYDKLTTKTIFQAMAISIYSPLTVTFLSVQLVQIREAVFDLGTTILLLETLEPRERPLLLANVDVTSVLVCFHPTSASP